MNCAPAAHRTKRRAFVLASAATLISPFGARAQKKTPVIGLLWIDSVIPSPFEAILLAALRERGLVAVRDFRTENGITLEGYGGLAKNAAELVRAKVDMIVVWGSTATVVAAKATKEIPIVTIMGQDPVAFGLASSLSRPGGNVTGIATLTADLSGKRIQLVKELVPGLERVGILLAANVGNPVFMRESEAAARTLHLQAHFAEVAAAGDIESRIADLAQARVGAIYVSPSSVLASHGARIVATVAKHRIPTVYGAERHAAAGGLVTLTASTRKSFARLAGYVDRILKGARAAELPIEQTSDLELVVNLKTAKALGINIPPSILLRADRVIQ